MIKNKLKEFLSELEKFKVQIVLVLDYKERNNCKIFHSSTILIASYIDDTFKSMHQCIMTKIKNWIKRLDCLKCNYKAQFLSVSIKNKQHQKMGIISNFIQTKYYIFREYKQ